MLETNRLILIFFKKKGYPNWENLIEILEYNNNKKC